MKTCKLSSRKGCEELVFADLDSLRFTAAELVARYKQAEGLNRELEHASKKQCLAMILWLLANNHDSNPF